jgi:cell division protein FtsL
MSVPEKQAPKNALKSILNYEWIVMNISLFLFLAFLAILYIANGHLTDKTIRQINTTQKELKELQFEYKTVKAELMRRSRAVEIENEVAPFGLMVAKEMPLRLVLEKRFHSADNNQKEFAK